MAAPRHLWSGDWRRESAEVAQELAERRAPVDEPEPAAVEVPPQPSGPSAAARMRAALGGAARSARARLAAVRLPEARSHRRSLLIFLATLASAVAAYAIVSSLERRASGGPAAAGAAAPGWLGVEMDSFSSLGVASSFGGGVLITNVVPGGPADAAGLEPGDVITQVGGRQVSSANEVNSAIARMHPGQRIVIQYQRGPFANTADVTLAARPPGYP